MLEQRCSSQAQRDQVQGLMKDLEEKGGEFRQLTRAEQLCSGTTTIACSPNMRAW